MSKILKIILTRFFFKKMTCSSIQYIIFLIIIINKKDLFRFSLGYLNEGSNLVKFLALSLV